MKTTEKKELTAEEKYNRVLDWCGDENNDAYTEIDNLDVLASQYLHKEELGTFTGLIAKIYDRMVKSGEYDEEVTYHRYAGEEDEEEDYE